MPFKNSTKVSIFNSLCFDVLFSIPGSVHTWQKTQEAAEPTSRIPVKVNRKHSKKKQRKIATPGERDKQNKFTYNFHVLGQKNKLTQ
jgi:hypothetical protein